MGGLPPMQDGIRAHGIWTSLLHRHGQLLSPAILHILLRAYVDGHTDISRFATQRQRVSGRLGCQNPPYWKRRCCDPGLLRGFSQLLHNVTS
jgi:hypothetical protein